MSQYYQKNHDDLDPKKYWIVYDVDPIDGDESYGCYRSLVKKWYKTREGAIYCRAVSEHEHLRNLISYLETRKEEFIYQNINDEYESVCKF